MHMRKLRRTIRTIIQSQTCEDEGDITCLTFATFECPSARK